MGQVIDLQARRALRQEPPPSQWVVELVPLAPGSLSVVPYEGPTVQQRLEAAFAEHRATIQSWIDDPDSCPGQLALPGWENPAA